MSAAVANEADPYGLQLPAGQGVEPGLYQVGDGIEVFGFRDVDAEMFPAGHVQVVVDGGAHT
jgi:hypothetical protein